MIPNTPLISSKRMSYTDRTYVARVIAVWMAGLALLVAASGLAQDEDDSGVIDVVIEDSTFLVDRGHVSVDEEVTIVLQNMDGFEHGFVWSGLKGVEVRVETEAAVVYGKGVEGLYIAPGAEARLSFTPTRSGRVQFHCDIHPDMTGEIAYLSVGAT